MALLRALVAGGWLQNLLIGVALMLTTPFIGKYIDGRRGSIIGLAIGVTILTWIIALVALRQVTKPPETPEQPKTSSDDMREKQSATYTTIGELLAVLGKEIDIVSGWAEIVEKKSEVAQFSIHFPAAGSIERLHFQLKEIEQLRVTSSLMLDWKIDALLYAIGFKGQEMLAAIKAYGNEKTDWELKRGHILASRGLGDVVSQYSTMCLETIKEKLSHRSTAIDWNAHSEEEARLFSKQLGDIGRKESKRFSEQYPTLAQRLRAANKTEAERQEQEFRFNLMADAFLDRDVGHSVALSPEQRIHFLEYLYSECLRFFFRMWNERDYAEREEQERVKLERLLRKVSDDVIVNAFRKMVMAVRKTSSETKPIRPEEFESESAFEQARLAIFRPSAVAYDRFRELTERHLEQLKADNDTGKDAQTK